MKDELIETLLQIVLQREYREKEDEEQTLFTAYDKVDQEWIESDIQFSTDKDISQSELDNTSFLLSRGDSMRDVCADELQTIEQGEKPPIQEQENNLSVHQIVETEGPTEDGSSVLEHSEQRPKSQLHEDIIEARHGTCPVLAAPRLDHPFKIQVDASQVGAGAVLLQTDEQDIDRPVCYFSRSLISTS